MAYDDPKLPPAVLRGEYLYVGNDKEPYVRDPDYRVHMNVTDLRVQGGFEPAEISEIRGPKALVKPAIRGLATLEGRDKFAVAGFDIDKNSKIEFHLRTVPDDETRFLWTAWIGYRMHDWEFDWEAGFWVDCCCSSAEFDRVLSAIRTGHVERLRVTLTTTMWTKQASNGFMLGMPMTFHVAPPIDKESTEPASERGFIQSINWDESYGTGRPAPIYAEVPPKQAIVDLTARAYTLLTFMVGLLAALVMLTFLRR